MDHVPTPLDYTGFQLDVPLLSLQDYDHMSFLGYPERESWGPRSILDWDNLFENPPREFQAFLQRWLYFGTLETTFGQKIAVRDFARWKKNDSQPYLCSMAMAQYTKEFMHDEQILANIATMLKAFEIQAQLVDTRNCGKEKRTDQKYAVAYYKLSDYAVLVSKAAPQIPSVTMATDSMIDFISNILFDTLSRRSRMTEADRFLLPDQGRVFEFPFKKLTWTLLRNQGWCPFKLAMMFERYSTAGLYYMSLIRRPDEPKQHRIIRIHPKGREDGSHGTAPRDQLCTLFRCGHRSLQDSSYECSHASGCGGCREVIAVGNDLAGILRTGSFPLIVSIDDDDENPKVQLIPWENGHSFIAISHVWSDGLGNVQKNAIPRCQLVRLSRLIRTLSGRASDVVLFWLGTLCVPRDSAMRKLAIQKMRQTYSSSCATLVLDSELFSISSAGMSDAEIAMRVFACTWNSRLWTFQEGALPSALYFQFEDNARDIDQLYERFRTSQDFVTRHTLGTRLLRQYYGLRRFRYLQGIGGDGPIEGIVLFIMNAMSHRTTSRASDEALCLATLLGLEMHDIVKEKPEERMKLLWTMIPRVPWTLLLDVGPKLDAPGLSWAPKTLLLTEERRHPFTGNHCPLMGQNVPSSVLERTDEGLVFTAPGMVIDCKGTWIGQELFGVDSMGDVHQFTDIASERHIKTRTSWVKDGEKRYSDPTCIHPHSIHPSGKIAFLLPIEWPTEGSPQQCLFVVLKERRGGTICARKVGTGFYLGISTERNILDTVLGIFSTLSPSQDAVIVNTVENKVLSAARASLQSSEQKWCLI